MIVQQTLTQLRALKLDGMASAFEEQLTLPTSGSLAFEDRFALLVERENAYRNTHRLKRLLTKARLKYGQACLEDLDTRTSRGLEAVKIASQKFVGTITFAFRQDWPKKKVFVKVKSPN